jgi:hypothetical protein
VQAVITYTIMYDASSSEAHSYAAPIIDLRPLQAVSRIVPHLDLPGLTGNGENDIACQKGAAVLRFPIYLDTYNVTALKETYDSFNQMLADRPALNNSFFLIEGYSTQGVQKIAKQSTAFAHRGARALL